MSGFLACPVCSNPKAVYRPEWFYCRHTTEKTGVRHVSLTGCVHVGRAVRGAQSVSDPEVIEMCEDAWNEEARRLFEERTKDYAPTAKACLAEAIGFSGNATG